MELAKNQGSNEPVRIRNIAEQHQVPPRFLVQILLQLKGAGIVSSTRGAAGGYHLIPKPEEVSLGQVMNIIDGPVQSPKRASDAETSSSAVQVLNQVWEIAEQKRQNHLCNISFADLVRMSEEFQKPDSSPLISPESPSAAPDPVQYPEETESATALS